MAAAREKVIKSAERYVSRGKIEAAIREYRKVLSDNPKDINTINRVGDLYARIERYDEAVALFDRIAEHYTSDGFLVKAIAIYKKIIKLDPTRLPVYQKLAELYHRQGLINEARGQYQVLVDYYQKHDDPAAALAICRRMVQLEPGNLSHRARMSDLLQLQGELDEAMEEYKAIAQRMLAQGHGDRAAQVYEKALDVNAEDVGFLTDAVFKLREAGHVAQAASLLSLAVERNPRAEQVARLVGEPSAEGTVAAGAEAPTDEMSPLDPAELGLPDASLPAPESPALEAPAGGPPAAGPPAAGPPAAEEPETSRAPDERASGKLPPAAPGHELDLDDEPPTMELEVISAEALEELPPAEPEAPPAEALEERTAEPLADPSQEAAGGGEDASPALDELPQVEFDLDLDEVFVLDLDDDQEPASQVKPPPDMVTDAEREAAAPALAEPAGEAEDEEEITFSEIELEELGVDEAEGVAELAASTPAAEAAPPPVQADPLDETGSTLQLDHDLLERTAAELKPPKSEGVDDLITEAEVLIKYGLRDKARERVTEALALSPDHFQARLMKLDLHLEDGAPEEVVELASGLAELAAEAGEDAGWDEVRQRLEAAGYRISGHTVQPPPGRTAETVVEEAMAEALAEPEPAQPEPAQPEPAQPEPAQLEPAQPEPEVDLEVAPAAPEAPLPEELTPPAPPASAAAEPPAGAPQTPPPEELDVSWLDEVAEDDMESSRAGEELFASEAEFFDLAAELEAELSAVDGEAGSGLFAPPQEQSLEEIVEGFKRGVAEHLSEEDYDTHFNLGIAYREMGLLDEAIGEFQLAAKGPGRLVECCSMLGMCFVEKGLPPLAVKWYRRGLEAPEVSEEESLGLLYDLGSAHLAGGDREAAYATFVELYGINSHYRDVVARLEELG